MISVVLCTYNGEKYLKQQLDSILTQSLSVDEIVIRDDCSSDSTCVILDKYSDSFPQIRYKRNYSNLGFVKNFESALKECKGDYIFFSDQDDIWDKDKVKISVSYLMETGMYGAFSDGLLIDQCNNIIGESIFSKIQLLPLISNELLDQYDFEILCLNGNYVTGATLVITKEAIDLVLPFDLRVYHDEWIAIKLSAIHKLGRINKPLISYRIHSNQECGLDCVPKDKYDLINCFLGKGDCSFLVKERRHSAPVIYLCNLKKNEKCRIFDTYWSLYKKNISKRSIIKEIYEFIVAEIVVFIKVKTGFHI